MEIKVTYGCHHSFPLLPAFLLRGRIKYKLPPGHPSTFSDALVIFHSFWPCKCNASNYICNCAPPSFVLAWLSGLQCHQSIENSSQEGLPLLFFCSLSCALVLHSSRLALNILTTPKSTPEKINCLATLTSWRRPEMEGPEWGRRVSGLWSILGSKGLWATGALCWEAPFVFFLIRFLLWLCLYNLYTNSKGRRRKFICSQDSTEVNCFSSSRRSYHTEVEQSHWRTEYLSLA